jgi:hypothetical protein
LVIVHTLILAVNFALYIGGNPNETEYPHLLHLRQSTNTGWRGSGDIVTTSFDPIKSDMPVAQQTMALLGFISPWHFAHLFTSLSHIALHVQSRFCLVRFHRCQGF